MPILRVVDRQGRSVPPSAALLIDRERDALDRVAAELAEGPRDQAHWADLRDRIDGIAARLRRAMRAAAQGACR